MAIVALMMMLLLVVTAGTVWMRVGEIAAAEGGPIRVCVCEKGCGPPCMHLKDAPFFPATDTFNGVSIAATAVIPNSPYETCYQLEDRFEFCWTKSYSCGNNQYCTCKPMGDKWHSINTKPVVIPVTQPNSCGSPPPVTHPGSCGPPCEGQHE